MRVIAGSARRLNLITIPGDETRPTTDRIKETLFNIINPYLQDAVFVDLFAGSGAIGIEALSRGAKKAVFIEKNRRAAECIKKNLEHTHFTDKSDLQIADVLMAVSRLSSYGHVDIVYMDPPYKAGLEKEVLSQLCKCPAVDEDTLIIIEAEKRAEFDFIEELGFSIDRIKEYKTNKHYFIYKTNAMEEK